MVPEPKGVHQSRPVGQVDHVRVLKMLAGHPESLAVELFDSAKVVLFQGCQDVLANLVVLLTVL
jgi:hypothetical protein